MLEQSATKAADSLLDKGTLGLLCLLLLLGLVVLGLAVRHLHKENASLHKQARDDRDRLIIAVEASSDATERFETVLREIRATLDARHQTVADLAQRVELIARDAQHGLRNVSQAIAGIAHLIDRRRPAHNPQEQGDGDTWGAR